MEFKKKYNNSVERQKFLDFLFQSLDGHKNPVDLKNADLYVIIEVFRDLLVFTIVPDYKDLKKFNLQQLVMNHEE